jgi:mono/diheme cytochrome c family protein
LWRVTILPRVTITTPLARAVRKGGALVVLLLAFPLALAAQPTASVDAAAPHPLALPANDGARIYAAACAACHGADGGGRTASEVGFTIPLPDFTDCSFANREADADWSATIHRGGPQRGFDRTMPPFGRALSDEQIDAVIAHLRSFCNDKRWPRGDLNMPRTLYTEKAFPEDESAVTTTIVTDGPDSAVSQFTWEKRFGALNQIEIGLPFGRADLGGTTGWKSGTGDLTIGVKHVLAHDVDKGSILSIGGEVTLPTGDEAKGFGEGTTIYESSVMYDKLLPRDSFLQFQAITEFPQDAALEDELVVRTAAGRTWTADAPFGRAWTPMVEVLAARELVGGAETEWDVVPQLQVSLSKRQHILAAAGVRIPVRDHGERPNEFVFYLLWDWYDGGLREGW